MNSLKVKIASTALVLSFASVALAQDAQPKKPPTPEDTQKRMETLFSAMAPVWAKATEDALDLQTRFAERPEVANRIAAYKKNLFEALKKQGFTPEQALQITLVTPLPSSR